MVILRYMFWTMALFLFGGCVCATQASLQYRWDVLQYESSGGSVGLFAADSATASGGIGYDVADGLLLNQRAQRISQANFPDSAEVTDYRVHYRDNNRGGDRYHHRSYHGNNSSFSRTSSYTIEMGG